MYQSDVTLKKISKLSGYSISTVSKALNNRSDISLSTRKLIKDIAKENNYIQNFNALALRKQQTKSIAIILPDITDTFFGELLSEFQKISFNNGYRVFILQSFDCPKTEKHCFKMINDGSSDGAIILSTKTNNCLIEQVNELNKLPYLFVEINKLKQSNSNYDALALKYYNQLLGRILDC
ncbi:LacI family DNA-binding transcriptional regulator [Hanstruepera ponticola]|uniref:LacI family DNA-binding transcriptional regulator n=1 Tax=Hanstruepera ponticola TaxID=2042995 RepID=UPI000CF12876|nr:LacI family DNA-binding transcriptional regulator [Hanstruepera ponticola]